MKTFFPVGIIEMIKVLNFVFWFYFSSLHDKIHRPNMKLENIMIAET